MPVHCGRKSLDNNSQNQNNRKPGNGRNNSWMMILALLCTVVVIFLFYNMLFGGKGSAQTKEYTEFLNDLENDRVEFSHCFVSSLPQNGSIGLIPVKVLRPMSFSITASGSMPG